MSYSRRREFVVAASAACVLVVGCRKQQETVESSSTKNFFGRNSATSVNIPVINEKIDTHTYRVDSATRTRLQQEWVRLGVGKLRDTNLALVAMGKIDHAEAEVLLQYSGPLYLRFTKLFRPNTTEPSSTALKYKGAVSAVNSLEPFTGMVYFGQKLPQSYVDSELRPGQIFSNNNFTSTSKSLAVATNFASLDTPNTAKSTSVVFHVEKSCHGRDISAFSIFAEEEEVIFQALHPFRVVERTQSPDGSIQNIKLEEVIPCPAQKPSPRKLSRASCVLKNSGNGFRIYPSENGGGGDWLLKTRPEDFNLRNGKLTIRNGDPL
jgi:hypothetical protein